MKHCILLGLIVLLFAVGCEKKPINNKCLNAKILLISCGGIVLQILDDKSVGEDWISPKTDASVIYKNCVLAGEIPIENTKEGDILTISFNEVELFTKAYNHCDIGGLPKKKIEIVAINCLN